VKEVMAVFVKHGFAQAAVVGSVSSQSGAKAALRVQR
jgi:hypothetical protein